MITPINKDIVKGLIYHRGSKTLNGETKHFSLVVLNMASDKPLTFEDKQEVVIMGAANLFDEINSLTKYEPPCRLGDISGAIQIVSQQSPDDLDLL